MFEYIMCELKDEMCFPGQSSSVFERGSYEEVKSESFLVRFKMHCSRAKLIDFRRLAVFGLILACFTEVIAAQTFNYSRGWTNGKRRSPTMSAIRDRDNEPESFDIWQMQLLKHLLELSHCSGQSQPREALDKAEDDFNRLRRYIGLDRLAYFNALPRLKI